MSDNLRRYHAIRNALVQAYPAPPTGNLARHLSTLAALISGIVGSKSTQLPTIAAKVPNGTKPESRVKRFARWFDNDHILEEVYFLPYAPTFKGPDCTCRFLGRRAWHTTRSRGPARRRPASDKVGAQRAVQRLPHLPRIGPERRG